jgi:hypothetical protein
LQLNNGLLFSEYVLLKNSSGPLLRNNGAYVADFSLQQACNAAIYANNAPHLL